MEESMIGIADEWKREKGRNEWGVSGQIFRKTEIEESVVLCFFLYQLTKRFVPRGFMSLHKIKLEITFKFIHEYVFMYKRS